jgi:hypothetical protein
MCFNPGLMKGVPSGHDPTGKNNYQQVVTLVVVCLEPTGGDHGFCPEQDFWIQAYSLNLPFAGRQTGDNRTSSSAN